ncbi:hypothetical protein OHC33_001571 [Knufia fluminis]|uniref:Uncharacterized protein n=1 Tax=Knufia fluminis TaxID=191047 RepID=A0AAN8IBK0_9EURO|nr:hypothetical protein OHC33_001571 [Knufia fluminis]
MDSNTEPIDDQYTHVMSMKEDVAAELEDFILLARLGIVDAALEIVDHVLWPHLNVFAVTAEVAGFLI